MVSVAPPIPPPSVRIKSAVYRSEVGRARKTNEDGVLCLTKTPLWAVGDGTGGPEPARVALTVLKDNAAQLAAKNADVAHNPNTTSRLAVGRYLEALFAKANVAVMEASDELKTRRIATTLCAATIVGQHAFVAHVGDSRAYLFRQGALRCLTNDHTIAALQLRRGDITASEFKTSPFQHTLAQAIGMSPALEVDLLELRLHPGDILLVTSNGLNRALSDEEIGKCLGAESDADARADLLVRTVDERGAPDNTTFILVETEGAPPGKTADAPAPTPTGATPRPAIAGQPSGPSLEARGQPSGPSLEARGQPSGPSLEARGQPSGPSLEAQARTCFLFKNLTETEWHQIQPYIEFIDARPGATLVRKGADSLGCGVLASGRLKTDLGAGETREIEAGGHFGALALATDGPSQETVTVLEPSIVYTLARPRFGEILRLNPTLGGKLTLALLESLGNRLGILTARLGQILDTANGKR